MAATTQDRTATARRYVERELADDHDVAASTTIPNGVITSADSSGNLVNAADTVGHTVLGISGRRMVNSVAAAGKVSPPASVRAGVFKFATTGANAITKADIGKLCYVLDNQTVVRAAGTTNSIPAGKVEAIDADGGIWVSFNL